MLGFGIGVGRRLRAVTGGGAVVSVDFRRGLRRHGVDDQAGRAEIHALGGPVALIVSVRIAGRGGDRGADGDVVARVGVFGCDCRTTPPTASYPNRTTCQKRECPD